MLVLLPRRFVAGRTVAALHSPSKDGRSLRTPFGARPDAVQRAPGRTPVFRRAMDRIYNPTRDARRSAGRAEPDGLERARLPARDRFLLEAGDRLLVHAMKVEPRPKAQERAAEADRRPLEKHEFARHRQAAALGLQGAHHLADLAPPVFRRLDAVGRGAHAIVENGPAHESRPNGHRLDGAECELMKSPHLEGMRGPRLIVRLESAIKFDDTEHEPRREDAHTAV